MSFVPDFDHDVFISYASVDNKAPESVEHGWVTYLVTELRRVLAEELGHSQGPAIWMDYELGSGDRITPVLTEAVANSATILIILSPGYLASEWCARERNHFLSDAGDFSEHDSRVFLVEKNNIDWDEKPEEIRDIKGKAFWVRDSSNNAVNTLAVPCPDPDEREYYRRVTYLARDLADQLRAMKEAKDRPEVNSIKGGPMVMLADVTDDLSEKQEEVRSYLQQHGIPVVDKFYPTEPAALRDALGEDLSECTLFVQLISDLSGRCPKGAEKGYPYLQYEVAHSVGVNILQWYSPELNVDELEDGSQKTLLLKPTVISEPFEHFKARVVAQAQPEPEPEIAAAEHTESLIFVNYGGEDKNLAQEVGAVAGDMGLDYTLPVTTGSPNEIRQTMENCMRESDAMVLLYGQVPETWVVQQLLQFRKFRNLKGEPRKGLAVYEGPPSHKESVGMKLADMHILDCRDGTDREQVQRFFTSCIRAQAGA